MYGKRKPPVKKTTDGKISYKSGILSSIIGYAVEEIKGVKLSPDSRAIRYTIDKDGVSVDVDIHIYYASSVSEASFAVQESVRHNVEAMTEFRVLTVNVNVTDVFFTMPAESTEEENHHEDD